MNNRKAMDKENQKVFALVSILSAIAVVLGVIWGSNIIEAAYLAGQLK